MSVYGVIYLITCLVTGMKYVGQTTQSLSVRINQHKRSDLYVDRAIKKYGWSDKTFKVEVLEECDNQEQLDERERYWIIKLKTKAPNGYNLADGGEGGCTFHEENFFKIAVARRSPSPYVTLVAELIRRKITYGALANHLGLCTSNLARKMRGEQNFTIPQMEAIRAFLGVDMPLEELFRKADGSVPDLTPKTYVYGVLAEEMKKLRISQYKLAEILGTMQSNISHKLLGKSNFTPQQKTAVKEFLQTELSIEELFARRDN